MLSSLLRNTYSAVIMFEKLDFLNLKGNFSVLSTFSDNCCGLGKLSARTFFCRCHGTPTNADVSKLFTPGKEFTPSPTPPLLKQEYMSLAFIL